MANIKKDLIGEKFERLTVLQQAEDYISPSGNKALQWLCKCDCGNKIIVIGGNLKNGHTKSCGCLRDEKSSERLKKKNQYDLSGEYGIGYTSKGEEFWFDLEDYDKVKDYCWCKDAKGYMYAFINKNGKCTTIKMHRLIMGIPDIKYDIDHKHGENSRYDNRKSNLRIATKSQNNMNKDIRSDNTSGITGVSFNKRLNKWQSAISIDKNKIHLGYFYNFDDAVKVRKEAEEKYFGEFSYDNSVNS